MESNKPFNQPLTSRENDILLGMVEGLTNSEIAERLVLSVGTVKWYVKQLYEKLGAHSREEAVNLALAEGLASSPISTRQNDDSENVLPFINPLPQDISDRYLGNSAKLEYLKNLLHQNARLISIYGRAGSGKTALACKAISDLRQSDHRGLRLRGIVCLSATSTGITLNRIFSDVGSLLHEKDQALLEGVSRNAELTPAHKIGIFLEKIAGKRIILLLDNLETVQNLETGELIESGLQKFIEMSVTQSSVLTLIITSREPLYLQRQLKTWENLISLEDGLSREDGIKLLQRFDPSGSAGLRDTSALELGEVVEQLGGFPRALESVAGMLLEDPLLRFADLKQTVGRLDGEISATVVEHALAHLNRESMQILEALAVFSQPVSYEALTFMLSPFLAEETIRYLVGRLIRACFVKSNRESNLLALHSIDLAYCYQQIPAEHPIELAAKSIPFTRTGLHRRAAQYFRKKRLASSEWRNIGDLEPQLTEFKHWVKAGDGDEAARVLLEIDRDYLWEWEYKELLRQLYPTLKGLVNDPHLVLHVARRQAWLHFFDGTDVSELEFMRLLGEARRLGFVKEEADALDDLAQIFRRGGRDAQQAAEYHQQALALYRQIGDRRGEADALGGLGAIAAYIEPEEAIDYFLAAAEIHRDLGNTSSLSFVMSMLGSVYENMGSLEQARKTFEEAIKIARQNNSLEALERAYGHLSSLFVLTGETQRVNFFLKEVSEITREFTGLPMTGQLMFYIGRTAIAKALTKDIPEGIALMEGAIRDAEAFQPLIVPFGNFFLSMLLTLGGDFRKARGLISQDFLVQGVGNAYWIGVLFIKNGEVDAAVTFFNRVLNLCNQDDHSKRDAHYREISTLPIRALALAGLALLLRDPGMASEAVELTRQMVKGPKWQMSLHRMLIDLLILEPGGEILYPVRDLLIS